MNLTRITYAGRKVYRDKLSGNTWNPGDTKLVTEDQATKLLRFAEFAPFQAESQRAVEQEQQPEDSAQLADQKETEVELEAAQLVQQESQRAVEQERQVMESILLTVESMDKGALEEYALKYEVTLDKRHSVAKLRSEVSTLIEQFGAR